MTVAASINPATGETIAEYGLLNSTAIDAALDRAQHGGQSWKTVPLSVRASQLHGLGQVLRRRAEPLARSITLEMGKPIVQARGEIEKCASLCEWYASNGPAILSDEVLPVGEDGAATLVWQPIGVVFGVMPWNFPVWQVLRAAVPILLAGNGFVLKHADNVLGCAGLLADAFVEAGFPDGAFTHLAIRQDDIARVIADRRIAGVTVTAGVAAGAAVAAEAGRHIKKSVLELGGIDPFIVLADANIDKAAEAAVRSRFLNTGQVCIAAKRFIVEESILDRFTNQVIKLTEALLLGDPLEESTFIGPMARRRGRDDLHRQVQATIGEGAELVLGGDAIDRVGNYYAPTILTGVEPHMTAAREELFGPVATIMAARDETVAVAMANQSDFGLSAALWTSSRERGERLARAINAGGVFVNGISASDPRVPIGGVGKSGYGRELSWFGPREFANAKLIWTR
jgi:succinate-semialdehyde dehydrogenase